MKFSTQQIQIMNTSYEAIVEAYSSYLTDDIIRMDYSDLFWGAQAAIHMYYRDLIEINL